LNVIKKDCRMLIIPADRGIDWRRAPVATLAIVILCTLIYFGWQWGDERRLQTRSL
jgi:hypothetical protein